MATFFASLSNSSGDYPPHDIFINYHGRNELCITTYLYSSLIRHGYRVFDLGKEEMENRNSIDSRIAAAIRTASVHIVIFSPEYADSECRLNELLLMLESMELGRSTIIPIFDRVKPADLRWTLGENGVYAEALTRLQEKKTTDSKTLQEKPRYDSDAIAKWRDALSEASNVRGFSLAVEFNWVTWRQLEEVVQRVLENVTRPPLDVSKYLTGLDKKVKEFEELLQQQSEGIRVMGIVGLGGVGKTTLATEIFNRLRSNYKHSCFLFDVREKSLITLQSDLMKDLSQRNVQIRSTDEGVGMLRRFLSSKVAFIILDNVDHALQLNALFLPAKDVLHSSSLIIVTSRDRQILINEDIQESSIYKLECLSQQHSQELFCLHAFGQPYPVPKFRKLVKQILDACQGLPLSLKLFGALLSRNADLMEWEVQLRKIARILPEDIQSSLRIISYERLDVMEQQIFLDIACFFIGENKDTAIRVWDGSGLFGELLLNNLETKCLVQIDKNNCISMHDDLKDLGRRIGERNHPHRLWRLTDNLLQEWPDKCSKGIQTLRVRGINMINAWAKNHQELANRVHGLHSLQLVKAEGDCLDESIFRSLQSPHLIWLRWERCPYSSLPSWIPMECLRVLELKGSATLKTLWREDGKFPGPLLLTELNVIDISLLEIPKSIGNLKLLQKFTMRSAFCRIDLTKLPHEFGHIQCLQHLEIMNCSMKSLPNTFGNLTNLQIINFSNLSELKKLPNSFGNLRNLQQINLSHCFELRGLPDSFGELKNLERIDLSYCSKIKRLPDSFGKLQNLQHIKLSECFQLQRLPNSFSELKNLQHIDLAACDKIEGLPNSFGKLSNLQHISLSQCYEVERLPDSFGELKNLQNINLSKLSKLKMLPDSFGELKNLEHIDLSHCSKIKKLPHSFRELKNLQHINLSHCSKIEELHNSLAELKNLQHVNLSRCFKLERLPDSFGDCENLQHINLSHCSKIERLPNSFVQLKKLQYINLSGCSKIEKLPDSFGELKNLQHVDLSQCSKLEGFPAGCWSREVAARYRWKKETLQNEM